MNDVQCLSHTKWECKFHIVWIPKCRRKMANSGKTLATCC